MKWFYFLCCMIFAQYICAQQLGDYTLTPNSIENNILQFKKQNPEADIAYSSDKLSGYYFNQTKSLKQVSLDSAIQVLLTDTHLTSRDIDGQIYIFSKPKYEVTINVLDALTSNGVPYAIVNTKSHSDLTDVDGLQSMSLYEGIEHISVDAIGYQSSRHKVDIHKGHKIILQLQPDTSTYQVVISDSLYSQSAKHHTHFDAHHLKHLTTNAPGLGGVNDIMHTIRSLPGIQSGSGGIGGHYVRGSSNGENHILVDGVPVFYPYHIMGLSSIFDGAFVKDVQVYKSGFDPKFGGRVSSVMDVHLKKGNKNKIEAQLENSTQVSSLMFQTPIIKEKSSLILYGRHSNWLQGFDRVVEENFSSLDETETKFYDFLGKYDHKFSDRTNASMFYYRGKDHIEQSSDSVPELLVEDHNTLLDWGNEAYSAQLSHAWSPKSTMSIMAYRSRFSNRWQELYDEEDEYNFFELSSHVRQSGVKLNYHWYDSKWQSLSLGVEAQRFDFDYLFSVINELDLIDIPDNHTIEVPGEIEIEYELKAKAWRGYIRHEYDWKKLSFQYGAHLSYYNHEDYSAANVEPRLNIFYLVDDNNMITASATKMAQYVNLWSSSAVNFPLDPWYPSTSIVPSLITWHYDLGWKHNFTTNYVMDVNFYYKNSHNVFVVDKKSDFPDVASLNVSGTSKGVEFNLKKSTGRLRGNFGYTLASSTRQGEEYNQGNKYDFQFDRRHELKLMLTYDIYNNWMLGCTAYYGSPHPKLIVDDADLQSGIEPLDFAFLGTKNTRRSDSHKRLDLSLRKSWQTGPLSHSIKVSLYNVMDNVNPVIYYENADSNLEDDFPGLSVQPIFGLQYTVGF